MKTGRNDTQPLVSVVVPVFNTERFVAETIRSVLGQTYQRLEIIIVIDGSTDGSLAICRGFDDPRIQIIEQENRGLAGARNTGIREARGELVGFIDSDDAWLPRKIERHVTQFAGQPDLGVGFSHSALMDEQGRSLSTYQKEGFGESGFNDFYVRNVIGNGSNAVLRRSVFTGRHDNPADFPALTGFDERLRHAEDYELWSRIAHKTRWKLACISDPLVRYRINPGGLSASVYRQRQYHFFAMALVAGYAPDEAEQQRTMAIAHTYWHQARIAVSQYRAGIGKHAVEMALWYNARSLTLNHVMISLAVAASSFLPRTPYYVLLRWSGRVWGWVQRLQVLLKRTPRKPRRRSAPIPSAASLVKAPEAYIRENAMPNLFFLCHRHRFMYLGISKNASTSIKSLIWREEKGGADRPEPREIHNFWGFTPRSGISIDREDRTQLADYPEYVKFAVYRDPVARFLSAYHDKVLFSNDDHPFYTRKRLRGMGLDQFIRVAESALKIGNTLHMDEHLRPQSCCFQPSDVDWIVPIEHLRAFLATSFGIDWQRVANRSPLPRVPVSEAQKERIRALYSCDYAIKPNWSPPSGNHP